jgi:photosystem II stability/assembly factor-like uncharacterized protein
MSKMKFKLLVLMYLTTSVLFAQEYRLNKIETNISSSFRGLSVVNNKVAWLSGSQGWVGRTTDGGRTWSFNQVKGFEESEFRSLYAFDDQHAVIANSGSPAHILVTTDGGKKWNPVYTDPHPDAFFDGMDFWNDKEGMIYGDPIEGKMLLLHTIDGGINWIEINGPKLEKGEASFAASGTGIRCINTNEVMISTGGAVSRLWISKDKGLHWLSIKAPIVQGESSTGIFSLAKNRNVIIIVGGDYQKESMANNHNFFSSSEGIHWFAPNTPTRGYRECVEPIKKKTLIAVGPSGLDISFDNGINWKPLSDEKGLHVVRKSRKGSLVLAAGAKGQLFRIR